MTYESHSSLSANFVDAGGVVQPALFPVEYIDDYLNYSDKEGNRYGCELISPEAVSSIGLQNIKIATLDFKPGTNDTNDSFSICIESKSVAGGIHANRPASVGGHLRRALQDQLRAAWDIEESQEDTNYTITIYDHGDKTAMISLYVDKGEIGIICDIFSDETAPDEHRYMDAKASAEIWAFLVNFVESYQSSSLQQPQFDVPEPVQIPVGEVKEARMVRLAQAIFAGLDIYYDLGESIPLANNMPYATLNRELEDLSDDQLRQIVEIAAHDSWKDKIPLGAHQIRRAASVHQPQTK